MRRASIAALLAAFLITTARSEEALDDAAPDLGDRLGALVASRDYAGALRLADAAIAVDAESVIGWQFRAYALHQTSRLAEAKAAYRRTIALSPENWWAHMNLASCLARLREWDAAIWSAEKAADLRPMDPDVQARLSLVHRDHGTYDKAATAVRRALVDEVRPAWAHAELAYLTWVLGELDSSRAHWKRAREQGANAAACAHGLRLVEWAEELRVPDGKAQPPHGGDFVFTVGQVEVRTRVGPRLPREVERLLLDLQRSQGRFLGLKEDGPFTVRLYLSRTREEHERRRRREFPAGPPGKAFHVDRRVWGGGPTGRRRDAGTLEMFVSWSQPGVERGLSHELAHAMIRMRYPRSQDVQAWLDEGVATYLELTPDDRGRLRSGLPRPDLMETFLAARRGGKAPTFAQMLHVPRVRFSGADGRALYAQSWSMIHYLVEAKGLARMRALLGAARGPFTASTVEMERIFGASLEALAAGWERHVRRLTR